MSKVKFSLSIYKFYITFFRNLVRAPCHPDSSWSPTEHLQRNVSEVVMGRHQEMADRETMQDLAPSRNILPADCVNVSVGKNRQTYSSFHLARFYAFLLFI